MNARRLDHGLTLVELIVVLTIIGIMSALAVPGLARMGVFSRDSLSRESRELFEMLSAARIYATTWNVRTAVVYNLDHYQSPTQNPLNEPLAGGDAAFLTDSLTNTPVRFIESACMMYAYPNSESLFGEEVMALKRIVDGNLTPESEEAFVPMQGNEGHWRKFEDNISLLLLDPDSVQPGSYRSVYGSAKPRFSIADDPAFAAGVRSLGMYPGLPVITDFDTLLQRQQGGAPLVERIEVMGRFVAHVFTPDGRLDTAGNTSRERFTFYLGYRPDEALDVRLSDPEMRSYTFPTEVDNRGQPALNLRVIPLELNRSTGRVKIAS